jgi:hypothetical protein
MSVKNVRMRFLACLLRLVNHRKGLKCFYAMSILVATVMLVLGFNVIDHLKTLMETLPEQNCKAIISQGELLINCSLIDIESLIETTHRFVCLDCLSYSWQTFVELAEIVTLVGL